MENYIINNKTIAVLKKNNKTIIYDVLKSVIFEEVINKDRIIYDVIRLKKNDLENNYSKEHNRIYDGCCYYQFVPFVKKVTNTKLSFNDDFNNLKYPKELQKEFTSYIEDVLCFDKSNI